MVHRRVTEICQIYVRLGDEAEAVRCYQDAHRMFPANMDVISWLGAFHVKNEVQAYSEYQLLTPRVSAHRVCA